MRNHQVHRKSPESDTAQQHSEQAADSRSLRAALPAAVPAVQAEPLSVPEHQQQNSHSEALQVYSVQQMYLRFPAWDQGT